VVEQRFAKPTPLVIRVNIQLVDKITSHRHESNRTSIHLRNPDIVIDQDHIPEIGLVFFEGVTFSALEIGKSPFASTSPENGDRFKVIRFVWAN
jgi:hypothetical protein